MRLNIKEAEKRVNYLIDIGIVNPHIGIIKKSIPVTIEGINKHARTHGISIEQAQEYVNTSKIMFDQGNRTMYLSSDGSATIIIKNNRLISAYSREYFDPAIFAILEVINNVR